MTEHSVWGKSWEILKHLVIDTIVILGLGTMAALVSWWLDWFHRFLMGADAKVPTALVVFKSLGMWTLLTFAFILLLLDIVEIVKKRWIEVFNAGPERKKKG